MTSSLTGLTWSHPRGWDPLRALARAAGQAGPLHIEGDPIRWDHQPLAGFESTSIESLCAAYDLLVLDHPHLGAATAAGALVPIRDIVGTEWSAPTYVGGALDSYRYADELWALPIDAACMVSCSSPGLGSRPQTWARAKELFAAMRSAVPTRGPHLLLAFLAVAAGLDPGLRPDDVGLVRKDVGEEALALVAWLVEHSDTVLLDKDPIELLDLMAAGQGPHYIPLTFGYASYSSSSGGRIRFFDPPREGRGRTASVLGGAGVAVTARGARRAGEVRAHVLQIAGTIGQRTFPDNQGQPALASVWHDPSPNAARLSFYRNTFRTQEQAWCRPRHDGWIAFQAVGSNLLRDGLRVGVRVVDLIDDLNRCYHSFRPTGAVD